MSEGLYHYIGKAWRKPSKEILRKRMTEWRKSSVFTRLEKPLRLDKARALGYKDKKGFVIIRVRIKRGGHKRPRPNKGRRSKRLTIRKNLKMNYKWIAEQRVAKKYKNLEVLNSYIIGKDGINYFYDIILVDPQRPEIKNDKTINWICNPSNKNRVFRGLTSSAKKSRGLRSNSKKKKKKQNIRWSMKSRF
ncbi:MAG: 50S ribosomal protein L15e [Candidatus Pacearchaeota archaeon]|nr:50S ribosomal protein L15e [Candidatus Pacearchaeota archaeon]